jgi:hypothetical protein
MPVSDDETWTANWDALCASLLRPLSAEEAARAIALEDFTPFPDRESAEDWVSQSETYDTAWFATGQVDGWTFIWEANGWQGATPENADRLSQRGSLVSMFWNVNSLMTFIAAEDGVVTRQFDPLFHDDDPSQTGDVGPRHPFEAGLDWEESPRMSGLALLATLTGTEPAQPSWLSAPGVRFWGHRF